METIASIPTRSNMIDLSLASINYCEISASFPVALRLWPSKYPPACLSSVKLAIDLRTPEQMASTPYLNRQHLVDNFYWPCAQKSAASAINSLQDSSLLMGTARTRQKAIASLTKTV